MKTAMILAAGRGSRLKPLTDSIPKALVNVHGKPLIEHHVINLANAGFNQVVINHAYLGAKIRHYLGDGEKYGLSIRYSPEPPGGLETGGGIKNALALLGNAPFAVINADIFTAYDFKQLTLSPRQLAHLVIVDKPDFRPHSDFGLSENGILLNTEKRYTFTGIACYHPDLFAHLAPGRFSMAPLLYELTSQGAVTGERFDGLWCDVGTPARLHQAEANFKETIS